MMIDTLLIQIDRMLLQEICFAILFGEILYFLLPLGDEKKVFFALASYIIKNVRHNEIKSL